MRHGITRIPAWFTLCVQITPFNVALAAITASDITANAVHGMGDV